MKKVYDGYEEKLKKKLDFIRHEVRFNRDVREEGINIDDDYDEQDLDELEKPRGKQISGMTNLRPTGDRGRGGQRGGRGRDFDRDGGNRGIRGNRGRRGRGGDDRYRGEQNESDYMGRDTGKGGNRNRDREENNN